MRRPTLPMLVLAFVLASAPPLRGQTVVLDEGTFRILRDGREVGTETFAIRRVGQGADAHVIANAVIELADQQVRPLLKTTPELDVSAYQVEVTGTSPTEIAVTSTGRRFVARVRSPEGEMEREFRQSPGSVLLEEGVAHQYWFLSQLGEGTEVTVLVPRAGSQDRIAVRDARTEALELGGERVQARHVTFAIDGTLHEVWYDQEGAVLRVAVPSQAYVAQRTAP